jgi:hypothetical protein
MPMLFNERKEMIFKLMARADEMHKKALMLQEKLPARNRHLKTEGRKR